MGVSVHREGPDRSPVIGSRKIHKEGQRPPYSYQRSHPTSDAEDNIGEAEKHSKPPRRRELIIARLQGPLASAWMQRMMKLRLKVLGAEHPDTMKVKSDLAEAWHQQQRHTDAVGIRVQLFELSSAVFGRERGAQYKRCTGLQKLFFAEVLTKMPKNLRIKRFS